MSTADRDFAPIATAVLVFPDKAVLDNSGLLRTSKLVTSLHPSAFVSTYVPFSKKSGTALA
jgi:hypothetical protein